MIHAYHIMKDENPNENICSICMETVKYGAITKCGHIYHNKCLQRWVRHQQTCPLCRNEFLPSITYEIDRMSMITIKQQMLDSVINYMEPKPN